MENTYVFGKRKMAKTRKKKKAKTLWICAVAALFWVMRQERDLLIFEGNNQIILSCRIESVF